MCYKHGVQKPAAAPGAGNSQQQQTQGSKLTLFPNSYFHRLESQQGCVQCQDRVVPEEVKSALGVCTVFLLKKTVQWATSKE